MQQHGRLQVSSSQDEFQIQYLSGRPHGRWQNLNWPTAG
jgi:hypothetical protein